MQLNKDEDKIELCEDINDETNVKEIQEKDIKDEIQINEDSIRKFISKGELTVCHIRCIIVGCAHAGKTTLLKRLENVPYEELKELPSTEIVDVHVNIFEINKDMETIECKPFFLSL